MELKLKRFIETHDNWHSILTNPPYNVSIKEDPNQHLFLFKYTVDTIWDNDLYDLLLECRGAIYYVNGEEVECVHMGLKKFFNYGEPNNRFTPNVKNCVVYQKIDGSNVSFWFWNGEWHCSSLGCIDAAEAMLACGRSLADLVNDVFGMPYQQFFNEHGAYTGASYVFELTHPDNIIVIPYKEPTLWFICSRWHDSWEELSTDYCAPVSFLASDASIKLIPKYNFKTLRDVIEAVKALPEDKEGYVVQGYVSNQRVKVKSPKYLELHHLRSNGNLTMKNWLEMRTDGTLDDFLGAFPHHGETAAKFARAFAAMVKSYDANWDFAYDNYRAKYGETNNSACFAHTIQSHAYKPYLFARWNGKVKNAQEFFAAMRPSQQLKHLESYMEDMQFESICEEEAH